MGSQAAIRLLWCSGVRAGLLLLALWARKAQLGPCPRSGYNKGDSASGVLFDATENLLEYGEIAS